MITFGSSKGKRCEVCGIACDHRQPKTTFWRGHKRPGEFWWFALGGLYFNYVQGKPWICERCVLEKLTGRAAEWWRKDIVIEP